MKVDVLKQQELEVEGLSTFESKKASVDSADMSWLLGLLSTNLYSNPVESLIRELVCNAVDANVEAQNTEPVIVNMERDSENKVFWEVRDSGLGLDQDDVDNIYSKFGKSTKRNSNEGIGMFGIGKFSPLSYTNEVFIDSIKDGVLYKYLMFHNGELPEITTLGKFPTKEPRGTSVRVYTKLGDDYTFIDTTKSTLAYFDNVVYENMLKELNEIEIIRHPDFYIAHKEGRVLRSMLHLAVGPVYYPLNINSIKSIDPDISLPHYSLPLAIRLPIGSVSMNPQREDIKYTKETVALIVAKVASIEEYLVKKHNENVHEVDSLKEYAALANSPKWTFSLGGKVELSLSYLPKNNLKEVSLKGCSLLNRKTVRFNNLLEYAERIYLSPMYSISYTQPYTIKRQGTYGITLKHYLTDTMDPFANVALKGTKLSSIKPRKLKYISKELGLQQVLDTHAPIKISLRELYKTCRLDSVGSKAEKVAFLKTLGKYFAELLKEARKDIFDKLQDVEHIQVPLEYGKVVRVNYSALRKAQNKIIMHVARPHANNRSLTVLDSKEYKVSDIPKMGLVVYGIKDDDVMLSHIHLVTLNSKYECGTIKVVRVSKTNMKYLKEFNNCIQLQDFMYPNKKEKTNYTRRFAKEVAYKIIGNYIQKELKSCSINQHTFIGLVKKMNKEDGALLDKYATTVRYSEEQTLKTLSYVLYENNLFPHELLKDYERVKVVLKKWELLQYNDGASLPSPLTLAYYKKIRIRLNAEHYKIWNVDSLKKAAEKTDDMSLRGPLFRELIKLNQ